MKTRKLNGYNVVYRPEHFNTMKSENWLGYVYEHRFIIEQSIGRKMKKDELVHHINGIRDDNRAENLLLMKKWNHSVLHNGHVVPRQCPFCMRLIAKRSKMCVSCSHFTRRKVQRPSRESLLLDLKSMSFLAVGRKYGVSDNAIRKWLRSKESKQ